LLSGTSRKLPRAARPPGELAKKLGVEVKQIVFAGGEIDLRNNTGTASGTSCCLGHARPRKSP
jgi:hypothetical protein